MQNKIKFFALGGLDENGKNMFVMEIDDNIYVLDAGIKYPDKHTPGVDVIIPKYDYLIENKHKVKAYIISHGHDDQMGALPYLMRSVPAPVYCSRSTKYMIEQKTKSYGLKSEYSFNIVKGGQTVDIAGNKFSFIEMTHAVPESLAIALYTEHGYILYTSDFIVDFGAPKNHQMDLAMLGKIAEKGVLLLMSESCDAEKLGHTSPKHRISPYIASLFNEPKGRVFISLYSQNAFNQKEVIDLAIKTNKKLVFFNKEDQELITNVEYFDHAIPKENIVSIQDINRVREQDLVFMITGTGEDIFRTLIELSSGIYEGRNLDFKETDTFVIASPSVSGTEVISIQAIDDVYKTGAQVLNLTRHDIASMHAQEEDLKMMLTLLKPKYYLPVKGDYRTLMANAKIALNSALGFKHTNIFVFDNGMILNIENGVARPDFSKTIPVGDLMVDSNTVGTIKDEVIQDRQKMGCDGVIIVSISVDLARREIVAGPDIQMRGFIFLKESENVVKQILAIFNDQIKIYLSGYYDKKEDVVEKIHDKVHRYVRRETGKNPLIIPVILDI